MYNIIFLLLSLRIEVSPGISFTVSNTNFIILEQETTYTERQYGVFLRILNPLYLNLLVSDSYFSLDINRDNIQLGGWNFSLDLSTRQDYDSKTFFSGNFRVQGGQEVGPFIELQGGIFPQDYFRENEITGVVGLSLMKITSTGNFFSFEFAGGARGYSSFRSYFRLMGGLIYKGLSVNVLMSSEFQNSNIYFSQDFNKSFIYEELSFILSRDSTTTTSMEIGMGPQVNLLWLNLRFIPGVSYDYYSTLCEMNSYTIFIKLESTLNHRFGMFSGWFKIGENVPETHEILDNSGFLEFSLNSLINLLSHYSLDISTGYLRQASHSGGDSQNNGYFSCELRYRF